MMEKIAGWIADFGAWVATGALKAIWPTLESLGYSAALVGGSILLVLYFGTSDKRFFRYTTVLVLVYVLIEVVGVSFK